MKKKRPVLQFYSRQSVRPTRTILGAKFVSSKLLATFGVRQKKKEKKTVPSGLASSPLRLVLLMLLGGRHFL